MTGRPTVTMTRLYGDENGDTHLARVVLRAGPPASNGAGCLELSGVPATTIAITDMEATRPSLDLHPPPRRQLIAMLRGRMEVTTTSGDRQVLGPGDLLLVDDVGSKGHATLDVGDQPMATVQVGVAPEWACPGA